MYYIYILFSQKDHLLYTGFTSDLKARLEKHQNGYVSSTKHRRPVILVYYEAYLEEIDARRREVFLKGGKGKSEIQIQLRDLLSKLEYKKLLLD